jgi:ribosomal protein S18 acetylase RimI-like enzyme
MGMRGFEDSREGIAKFLGRNPTCCFVAVNDGKIVGSILCGHDGRKGYFYHTAVDDAYRRQGVGSALVLSALDALEKEGITRAGLFVYKKNTAGISFWTSAGWEKREDIFYYNLSLTDE